MGIATHRPPAAGPALRGLEDTAQVGRGFIPRTPQPQA